jgi:hypothetical protein
MASGNRGSWNTVHDENLATYTTTLLDLLNTHLHFNILLISDNPVINKVDSYLRAGKNSGRWGGDGVDARPQAMSRDSWTP